MKKKQEQEQVVFVDKQTPTVEYVTNGEVAFFAILLGAIIAVGAFVGGYVTARNSKERLKEVIRLAAEDISQDARDAATRAKPVWLGIGNGESTRWYNISQPNWHIDKTIESLTRVRSYVGDDPKNAPTNSAGWMDMSDRFGHGRWVAEEDETLTVFGYPVQARTPTVIYKYENGGWTIATNVVTWPQ